MNNRKYLINAKIREQLQEEESRCNCCKRKITPEDKDWYPIEYFTGLEDEDGNPIKVHSWICPHCGVSMLTGVSQSFSISSGI